MIVEQVALFEESVIAFEKLKDLLAEGLVDSVVIASN